MIHLDRSGVSIVAWCDRCPGVRELATSPAAADSWVATHAQLHADDDARRAVKASRARERRRDAPSI